MIRGPLLFFLSSATVESGQSAQYPDGNERSPLGPIPSSVEKPSGPAAMLVGIKIAWWEDLSDLLGFLLNR